MDEIVNMVSKKTGLTTEMSRTAVAMVLDFIKKKLPVPMAGQIDAVLGSGKAAVAAGVLGDMFGKK